MFNRVIYFLFLVTLVFLIHAPTTAYGQSEPRERPDTVGPRSVVVKDNAESRRDRQVDVDPQAKVDEQLRSAPRTANLSNMRRKAITTAGTATENAYEDAIARARLEYETKFKEDLKDETFINSHATISLVDFARAYIIALNPIVQRKLGGYQLAVLRSMTTTYDDYDEILFKEVPELSKEEVKSLVDNAVKVVKAALSKQ